MQSSAPAATPERSSPHPQRRAYSPYTTHQPITSPDAIQSIKARLSAGPAHASDSPTFAPPAGSPTTPPPATATWLTSLTSPFLSDHSGYRYQQFGGGLSEQTLLPKYHHSLTWKTTLSRATTTLTPSAPRDVDDALQQLDVDLSGLRNVFIL
jgi:hypothetical protein